MAIIKEAEFKNCGECGWRHRVSEEVRGCDVCKTVFAEGAPLSIDIFDHDSKGSEKIDCCSWRCVFAALPTIECNHFVVLPYLSFDDMPEGARAQDFFAAVKAQAFAAPPDPPETNK